jgi:predicted SAM-dependent methyltransferase
MSKRFLHIGCGPNILPPPFENLDAREIEGADHISAADDLKQFEDDTFDMVYGSHILEHYARNDVEAVLMEWVRVTKVDGIVRISVPSFKSATQIYDQTGKLEYILGPISGGQTYDFEFHYCVFDERTLTALMKKCKLTAIHPWLYTRTEHSDYWDFSQAVTNGIQVSLNLEGRKRQVPLTNGLNYFETKKDKMKQGMEYV